MIHSEGEMVVSVAQHYAVNLVRCSEVDSPPRVDITTVRHTAAVSSRIRVIVAIDGSRRDGCFVRAALPGGSTQGEVLGDFSEDLKLADGQSCSLCQDKDIPGGMQSRCA